MTKTLRILAICTIVLLAAEGRSALGQELHVRPNATGFWANSSIGTGPELSTSEYAQLDAIVADLDDQFSGIESFYYGWRSSGGRVGRLAAGRARDEGLKGVTDGIDGSVILIDTRGNLPNAVLRARVLHELAHVWYGGAVLDCDHATIWFLTYIGLKGSCEDQNPTPCSSFRNAISRYNYHFERCLVTAPGSIALPMSEPDCCE